MNVRQNWDFTINIYQCLIHSEFTNYRHYISAYMAKCENISFVIVILYKSPRYSKAKFCEDLQQFLDDLCERSNDVIIARDYNLNWQSDFYKSKLECILNDNWLKQIMKEFTKITKNSKKSIDYIIINNDVSKK